MSEPKILSAPMREVPTWAVLERKLMDAIESSWRGFSERYTEPNGALIFDRPFEDRDGVDDFYEAFFNWPTFYSLGGSDEILAAAKHHWEGVTEQLTAAGMLTDEFENGYDWFHQGESLIFFYALCAADPKDPKFKERAQRFAKFYLDPARGNYDADTNVIKAPHNGSLGALEGLGPQWQSYSNDQPGMRPYGLPIEGLAGITQWDDLADPAKAEFMGQEMQRRAVGDVAANLCSTSLVANYWLYDGDAQASDWVLRYVDGWRARAAENDGLIPDNAGLDGQTGTMQDGLWYGGHYGWNWPHGLPSVGMGALIGAINAALVCGDNSYLDLVRVALDTVLEHSIQGSVNGVEASLQSNWQSRLGPDADTVTTLVPHRFGPNGWFDYSPIPIDLPMWVWWISREEADRDRLAKIMASYPEDVTAVRPFRDKAESGHELPWLSYLEGNNPDYPEQALAMALGQVARRVALMNEDLPDPKTVHIHYWQGVNPVVTEVLSQLITGAPQVLYNGGLPLTTVSYEDADRNREGLPLDVAALVTDISGDTVTIELVNLSLTETHRVRVRPGRFGERDIVSVRSTGEIGGTFPGTWNEYTSIPGATQSVEVPVQAPDVLVELAPFHQTTITITSSSVVRAPRHHSARN